ncbi:uncharacterized protein LOC125039604 isoform X2 [Penaeus chinensis]|uniref:uncharacterized protein LOC125039604 isoform X2 n=1 Tax=Penaeus chinensis TaxID=139456 RepID=UPI001FB5DF12|nr:uncharacterized protein LOC125039604 isoform X2 [Penaeus chinensis]
MPAERAERHCREPISNESREEIYANFRNSWYWKDHQNKRRIQQILDEKYNFAPFRPYEASRVFYQNVTRVRVTCIYCSCVLLTYDVLEAHHAGRKHKRQFERVQINNLEQPGSHRAGKSQEIVNESHVINHDLLASGCEPPVVVPKRPGEAFEPSVISHKVTAVQDKNSDASFHKTLVASRKAPAGTAVQRPAKKQKSTQL